MGSESSPKSGVERRKDAAKPPLFNGVASEVRFASQINVHLCPDTSSFTLAPVYERSIGRTQPAIPDGCSGCSGCSSGARSQKNASTALAPLGSVALFELRWGTMEGAGTVAAAAESPAKAEAPLPTLAAPMGAPSLSSLTVLQPVHSTTIPGYASFAQYAAPAPLKPQPLLNLEDANHNTTAPANATQDQCPDVSGSVATTNATDYPYASPYSQYSSAAAGAYAAYGYGSGSILNPSYYYTHSGARSTAASTTQSVASLESYKASLERC
ncbi:hypothetical protein BIW11_11824 [Tropilaelaps mercedesae]|uniref:Uncharacterized protein n=1 Tax=Tropilaelaps mercedesae TaxID=418985 RepID=A0A1V9X9C3_9ACAR|nr:hypothetical protein BIW11_11824 [Tropilaelaps mercedesae]